MKKVDNPMIYGTIFEDCVKTMKNLFFYEKFFLINGSNDYSKTTIPLCRQELGNGNVSFVGKKIYKS